MESNEKDAASLEERAASASWIGPANLEEKKADQVASVFEFSQVVVLEEKKKWKCLWCNQTFSWNATKARHHLAKEAGNGIAICPAAIHPDAVEAYRLFSQKNTKRMAARKRTNDLKVAMIEERQQSLTTMVDNKRQRSSSSVTLIKTPSPDGLRRVEIEASSSTNLTAAIVDLVCAAGLPFSFALLFRRQYELIKCNFQFSHRLLAYSKKNIVM